MKELKRDAHIAEVFDYIESNPVAILLFVDQMKFCTEFSNFPWVRSESTVVEIDQEILDYFQIGVVPQFRFYVQGSEVASIRGTCSYEEFQGVKSRVMGNLSSLEEFR